MNQVAVTIGAQTRGRRWKFLSATQTSFERKVSALRNASTGKEQMTVGARVSARSCSSGSAFLAFLVLAALVGLAWYGFRAADKERVE
jgi:hypothetical protein